jgi:RNA polymerase sigma-70 factor (ECF subfamily)
VGPITDQQLLQRFISGETDALTLLYERYRTRLYAFCYHLLGDKQEAEDAVHETFWKLCHGANGIAQPGAFQGWLFRIARNEALMQIRSRRKTVEIADDDVWEEETPLSALITTETAEIIQSVLRMLKTEYREVILLREYEQFSYAEIAAITDSTESSVKSRLFKARKALASKLEPLLKEGRKL